MRSIFVLLILVMIGLNGKGQSVTALPDSVLSQCCLEVTLLNGNVTTVDWVFVQYITRDGTGTKLFVEYAPNFGGIQWETQIRIQDDFNDVLERSKFIVIPFTVGSTDYGINRNWIANIEENTTTGGTWIYGRFGTPTKRKFSAVEDYETMKNLLLVCRPRAIVVAENGLYTEGDTVRMGGFLIENTKIRTAGYNWQMKDDISSAEFGLDYSSPFGDTAVYSARRTGKWRLLNTMGRKYWGVFMEDTTGVSGIENRIVHSFYAGTDDPYVDIYSSSGTGSNKAFSWFTNSSYGGSWAYKDGASNPYYTHSFSTNQFGTVMGSSEGGTGDPGNGVQITTNGYGIGADEWIGIRTKNVDNRLAHPGQYLSLVDSITGKVEFATIDLSAYLPISDTSAMLVPYIDGYGTIGRIPIFTGTRTIGNSQITYNSTTKRTTWDSPGILELPMGTDAQRPTATASDFWYNTTGNGIEWYNGSRWAKGLESTFNRGTATRIPFFDANGQITDNAGLTRNATTGAINESGTAETVFTGTNTTSSTSVALVAGSGSTAASGFVGFYRNGSPIFTTNGSSIIFNLNNWQAASATGITFQGGFGGATLGTSITLSANTPNTGPFTATSGTQVNLRVGGISNTWQPSSGNATWNNIYMGGVINPSGTYVGTVRGIYYQPTMSSTTGLTHRAWESTSGDMIVNGGSFGLGTSSPQRLLHVAGEARITDLTTDTPTRIVGADADGDLGAITVSTGLDLTGGVLTTTGASTWLKTELEASRDVTIAGGSSTDFRIQTTRIQFDGKTKIGSDSSFVHDPAQDTTFQKGTAVFGKQSTLGRQGVSGYPFVFRNPAAASSSILIESGQTSPTGGGAGLQFLASGQFGGSIVFGTATSSDLTFYSNFASRGLFNVGLSNFVTGNKNTVLVGSTQDPIQWGLNGRLVVYDTITSGKALFLAKKVTSSSTPLAMFSSVNDDRFTFNDDGTTRFHIYGTPATTAPALSKTQSNYNATFATDGTVVSREQKRDTTIYVVDTDYDFSAALTTAQVASRFNRVIFLMTTTAAAGSDSELTLHTPDINLMQCEYLVRSTDEAGGFDNKIIFGTNNAVSSTNTLATNYFPAAGQGVGVRIGLRSGVYKYYYY